MLDFKEVTLCLFFSSCVYAAIYIPLYRSEKRDKQSEPAQIYLTAAGIVAAASAVGTGIFSMVAMMLLGVHGGYWLTAVILTLVIGSVLIKRIWESMSGKFNPMMIGGYLPIFLLDGCIGIGLLVVFWLISLATGIAVQYANSPFKF